MGRRVLIREWEDNGEEKERCVGLCLLEWLSYKLDVGR